MAKKPKGTPPPPQNDLPPEDYESGVWILTGFCGADGHTSCRRMSVNGERAANRFIACRCTCHDRRALAAELAEYTGQPWDQERNVTSVLVAANAAFTASLPPRATN